MEHEPITGHARLAPPDADTARQYLAQAESIVERRERVVDRRAGAWLTIANAGIIAGYLAVATINIRRDVTPVEYQALLIPILLWGQISNGISGRGDRGPRAAGREVAPAGHDRRRVGARHGARVLPHDPRG